MLTLKKVVDNFSKTKISVVEISNTENSKNSPVEISNSEKNITSENFSDSEISAPKIPQPCPTCLSPLYWQSAYSEWNPNHLADLSGLLCVECEPPPAESLVRRRVLVAIEQPHYVEVDRRMRLLSVLEIAGGGLSQADGTGSPTNLDASSPGFTPFSSQAVCVEIHLPNQRRIEGDQTFSDPREPLRIWTTRPGRYQVDKYSRIAAEDLAIMLSFPDLENSKNPPTT